MSSTTKSENGTEKRVRTFVEGFDEALGGGVPGGSVVLISGLPGTMKSSLAYNILFQNAANNGLRGLYVTLEQKRDSIQSQMFSMGFTKEGPSREIEIFDIARIKKEAGERAEAKFWIEYLKKVVNLKRRVSDFNVFVLDSLDAMEFLDRVEGKRSQLFHLFEWIRGWGITAFLITEAPPEPTLQGLALAEKRSEADYLADGIIHLKMHQVNDVDVQRRIRCIKMRGTRHETSYFALVFENGVFSITRPMSM
ncbi:MAG: RAD55 family ATPase [Thermoplasmata archaeon]